VVLPDYLQPSIPTKSNAPWKNKDQRAAAQAAKVAASKGLPPPPPPMPTPEVRWLRLPLDGTELPVLPAVLPDGEQERQACSLEEYGSDLPQDSSLAGLGSPPKRKWASGGSGKQKKQRAWGEGDEEDQEEGVSHSAAPHSQEARDAKSGKGRKRLFLHPIIRTRDRCGKCSVSGSARCCSVLDLQSLRGLVSHRCCTPALLLSKQRGQRGVGPAGSVQQQRRKRAAACLRTCRPASTCTGRRPASRGVPSWRAPRSSHADDTHDMRSTARHVVPC
jgi:hypothetical protein